eukprot:440359_1
MSAEQAAQDTGGTTTIQTKQNSLAAISIGDPEIHKDATSKQTDQETEPKTGDDEPITIKTDKRTPDIDAIETEATEQTTTKLKDTDDAPVRSADTITSMLTKSFGVVPYKMPRSVSRARLKHTVQSGYLFIWLLAISCSSLVIIVDWAIVKGFNITLCDIENNTDGDQQSVAFTSMNAFAGFIQQLWLIIICLGGFSLFYLPNLVGITEEEDFHASNCLL